MPIKSTVRKYGIRVMAGPLATVYACPCCKEVVRIPRERNPGRGFGLRTGGAAFSRMCAHVRAEHPDQPAEAPARANVALTR
ncbi:hypothetical protein [Rhizobium leguminosarum]|jgi:hypothetical protein|uniref:hypothetical protein n=1 Tax=Rhizobium leguminosarum TaxID=384 RepID=UPI002E0EED59|nr:hypothetical protein U8Q02_42105 [Rhizobium leguminosarum]